MKKITLAIALSALSFNCAAAFKDDLLARFPVTKDAKIERAFGDFYSVIRGNEVIFVNSDISILINGEVIDLKQNRSITTSLRDANKPKLNIADLNLQDAIKFGTGSEKIYIFSDPDCPFCKRLEGELEKLTDLTIYVFPFPITGLHPNAATTTESIWCNKDRAGAWRNYVLHGTMPASAKCKNPLEKNISFAQKNQIYGTPAIIFEDGKIIPGAVSASAIRAQLDTYKTK